MKSITGIVTSVSLFTILTLALLHAGESSYRFPTVVGWSAQTDSTVYRPRNLYDIIDGAADLFLMYGFVDLTLAEYRQINGPVVRVELYRHTSRNNAFGIYSQERSTDYRFIDLATQGYIEDGVLNFLRGVYYVKMTTHTPGKQGRDALLEIAGAVDRSLGQDNSWPAALALFPQEGKIANSETYIAESFLGYRVLHSAFVAEYSAGFKLFIIECDSAGTCRLMLDAYLALLKQNPGNGMNSRYRIIDPHNGPLDVMVKGRFLLGAFSFTEERAYDAPLDELARNIPPD